MLSARLSKRRTRKKAKPLLQEETLKNDGGRKVLKRVEGLNSEKPSLKKKQRRILKRGIFSRKERKRGNLSRKRGKKSLPSGGWGGWGLNVLQATALC